jgi:Transmembrane family 220, helix
MLIGRSPMSKPFVIADLFFGLLFLFAAAVQYNDPDPLRWMAIYSAGAAASFWSAAGSVPRHFVWGVLGVAVVWALSLLPAVVHQLPSLFDLTGSFQMMAPGVEETRECGGLLITAAWMGGIAVRRARALRRAAG